MGFEKTMGCCLNKQIKDKDEPLLSEHLSGQDNTTKATIVSIESTQIKNDKKESKLVTNESVNKKEEMIDVIEPIADIKIKKQKKKKRNLKKRDSQIDIKDLMKLNNFTERMKEKEEGIIITLKIKSMDTNFPLFKVSIDQNLTVMDLKTKICEQSPDKIIAVRQRLIHKGRLLKDVRTLKQYKISDTQTLMLVRSRRNQQNKKTLKVSSHNTAKNMRSRAMTIGEPQKIYQRSKTPQPQQISRIY